LFLGIHGLAVFHEPTPKLTFEPEWGPNQESELRSLFLRKKIFYILQAAAGNSHYIETNHLFIKSFAESAIEYFGDRIKIIHLRRDPVFVALSYYRLGIIAGYGDVAFRYMLDPNRSNNIISSRILTEPGSSLAHDFYRNLWYWYELEARIERMRLRYPTAGWIDLHTDDLNNPIAVRTLCDQLGINEGARQICDRAGLRSNTRISEKESHGAKYAQLDVVEAQEMHNRFRAELLRRGHPVPVFD